MSARIYGHNDGYTWLDIAMAGEDAQGVPMTMVSMYTIADDGASLCLDFTPPALRALHVAIGVRLVETDRLQTGRPARLVWVVRDATDTTYGDDLAELAEVWRAGGDGENGWVYTLQGNSDHDRMSGRARTRELAEADVAALLRARGYVVEGG